MLPREESPCPSCTALLDQLDGAALHIAQRMNFAVVAKTPVDRLLTFARERGWRHLRLLSSALNQYSQDYYGEVRGCSRSIWKPLYRETLRFLLEGDVNTAAFGEDRPASGSVWNLPETPAASQPSPETLDGDELPPKEVR